MRQCARFLVMVWLAFAWAPLAGANDAPFAKETETLPHKVPFIYHLQGLNRQLLTKINPAVAVVDPYDSGLKAADVTWLRRRYGQTLIAYLSIGEVDPNRKGGYDGYAFREAWAKEPWMTRVPQEARKNAAWDSARVEYWDPGWRAVVLYHVKKLAELGYDGAMFDTVDSYLAMEDHYRRDLRQDMVDLIARLRQAAQEVNPNFKIYINNGMALYDYKDSRSGKPLLELIDGQLKEDTFYNEKGFIQQPWTKDDLAYIRRAIEAGKPVFSIDYFTNDMVLSPHQQQMSDYMLKARAHAMIPFAADRSLGKYLLYNESYFSSHFSWDTAIKAGVHP